MHICMHIYVRIYTHIYIRMHVCECIMMLDHKWNLYSLLQTCMVTYIRTYDIRSDGQGVNGFLLLFPYMVANSFYHYKVYHDKFPFIKNALSYVEAKMHNARL